MSQEELGRRLGVTFQQVQKYENGTNRMSAGRLVELAVALDTDVMSLFDGVQAVDAALGGRWQASVEPDVADLMAEFMSIPDAALRKALLARAKRAVAAARSRAAEQ